MRRPQRDFVKLARDAERADDLVLAEKLYRKGVADRDSHAYNNLAQLLSTQDRLEEVESLFRQGIAAADQLAAKNLVLYLLEQGAGNGGPQSAPEG